MSKRLCLKMMIVLCILMVFLPGVSMGFGRTTRCQIIRDAIDLSPEEIKPYLDRNFKVVHQGIHFVDRVGGKSISTKPRDTRAVYTGLVKSLKAGEKEDYNTKHRFGVLACVIAETICPDKYKTPYLSIPKKVIYKGFKEIADIDSTINRLIEKYRKPYKGAKDKKTNDILYNVAVNEIVNHWTTAWKTSGNATGKIADSGTKITRSRNVALRIRNRPS